MKKEYVVTEITAAPDGAPYVLVTLRDPRDMRERKFGPQVSTFTSMEDLFRNFGRTLTTQLTSGFATVIRLGLNEYEELNMKVGDKMVLDISKAEVVGV